MERNEKKRQLEERIIKSIIVCLEEKDIQEMSADEIAGNAGVSKRTLYKYFASKKEMRLGVAKFCFKELSGIIASKMEAIDSNEPYLELECIGECYLRYCLENRAKCKVITSFNENEYIGEFPSQVDDIVEYSEIFEISGYVEKFFRHRGIEPTVSVNSLSLYLWAHVQGLAALIDAKRSWIEDYYHVDLDNMIREHLKLGRILLEGTKNE